MCPLLAKQVVLPGGKVEVPVHPSCVEDPMVMLDDASHFTALKKGLTLRLEHRGPYWAAMMLGSIAYGSSEEAAIARLKDMLCLRVDRAYHRHREAKDGVQGAVS
jgi:hypothetical protein